MRQWAELSSPLSLPSPFPILSPIGVCGSDVHTITAGWGAPILPCVTGHEIVGKVTKVGPKVTEFKKGDHVGVGAQVQSCGECKQCTNHNEQYCQTKVVSSLDALSWTIQNCAPGLTLHASLAFGSIVHLQLEVQER